MNYAERIMVGCVVLAASAAIAQTKTKSQSAQPPTSSKADRAAIPDRGQQVFNQNCSRCHNAPEGFPPSVSGTIARHMRVRASLSEADYKALLRFLNP
jgi:mono/diheme cytochrome c family protein